MKFASENENGIKIHNYESPEPGEIDEVPSNGNITIQNHTNLDASESTDNIDKDRLIEEVFKEEEELQPGEESGIRLERGLNGLGIMVTGGSDTVIRGVIIREIRADGAAGKDGRLRPGDFMMQVCSLLIIVHFYILANS